MAKKIRSMESDLSHNLLESLSEAMEFYRNPDRAVQMSRYMKNKFDFVGIPQPVRKELAKPFIKESRLLDMETIQRLATELWQKPEREYQYIAMELLYTGKKKWTPSSYDFFLSLITDKSWWDTVDFIASRLIGEFLLREKDWSIMNRWILSDNIWQNRTALIFQLNYKQHTNTDFLFAAIQQLQPKKEFFIQKAIGWSLRQYYRTAPEEVTVFVDHVALTGLAKREALKHA